MSPRPRRRGLLLLAACVLLAHGLLLDGLAMLLPAGAAAPLARMEADFITALRPAEPVTPPQAPARPAPPEPSPSPAPPPPPEPAASRPLPPEPPASAPAPLPALALASDPEPDPADPADPAPAEARAAGAAEPPAQDPAGPPESLAEANVTPGSAPPGEPAPPASAAFAGAAAAGRPADRAPSAPDPAAADAGPARVPAPASGPAQAGPLAAAAGAVEGELVGEELRIDGFAWPASTEIRYRLSGEVRGEVQGSAAVRWLREGRRYQVHLDVIVGPSFAPLLQRRTTSAGRITAAGLVPEQYEERNRIAFAPERRARLDFAPGRVTLPSGRQVEVPADVQDSASQFIQLAWRFARQARALAPGDAVDLTLALPRRVDGWTYDVVGLEPVDTPEGPVPAWHLRPRRAGEPSTYAIEAWLAPSLRWMPVRMRVTDGRGSRLELELESLPRQARTPARPAASAPAQPLQ